MKKTILSVLLAIGLCGPVEAQQSCFGSSCPGVFGGTVTFLPGANLILPLTTFASQGGIVYKNATPWLHDFNYGYNGTVTTFGWNTFLGINAGNFTMGSTATLGTQGSYNTGISPGALYSNTTGNNNVVVGNSSLFFNTSGSLNSALGNYALNANTTGSYNTAIGIYSMALNTKGSSNVAIGEYALRDFNATSAVGTNVAVGSNTARGIVTGVGNTILGANIGTQIVLPASLSNNVIIATGGGGETGAGQLEGTVRIRAVPEFNLTDNTATTFAVLTLGNDTGGGVTFEYDVYAADATTGALEHGAIYVAGIDVTAGAGGEVCTTPALVGTPTQALSGSTLAVTFSATTGTDLCNIRVTADTNIATPVSLWIKWTAINSGRTLTPQ